MKDALKKSFEVLLKNGEYAEAEKLLVPYMKENPDDWDAKLLYGTCRLMQGDVESAKLIHQQGQGYFETSKNIPEEQKSFWDKYKKLIVYGAIGTALVLAGGAYLGKQMQDVFEALTSAAMGRPLYAGPQQPLLVRAVDSEVDHQTKYAGPMRPEMEQQKADPESLTW